MTTEKIRIWHPYRADVLGKGQRKPRRMVLRAPIELEVPAISRGLIQEVGRIIPGSHSRAKAREADAGAYSYKGWNGTLWAPMWRGAQYGETGPAGWESVARGRTDRPSFLHDPVLIKHEHRTGRCLGWNNTVEQDQVDGEIVDDDRSAAATAVRDLEKGLLLVDGKIWQRLAEPVWAVQQLGLGCYCVYLDAPDPGRNPYRDNAETTFRADRLDDMLAWCTEIGRMRHRHPETFGPSGRVVEFDPAYLNRDDLVLETCRIGEQVLKAFAERIDKMTLAGADAYVAARSAHERLVSVGSRTDIAPFLEAVEGARADLRRFDYPDAAVSSRDEALKIVDLLNLRLRRFEDAALAIAYNEAPPEVALPSPRA